MRKLGHYIVGAILVAAALAAIFLALRSSKSHDDATTSQHASTGAASASSNKACAIFTAADAKALLGSGVKVIRNTPAQSSADLDISTCTYTQSGTTDTTTANRKSASLLVRASKTDKGIASNHTEFGALKPTTVQDVAGYGDSAYWDAEHGQLNILKNNNWYILSYGAAPPAQRGLDQARQLADLLISKM